VVLGQERKSKAGAVVPRRSGGHGAVAVASVASPSLPACSESVINLPHLQIAEPRVPAAHC